jgi:EAL domain-containing protein (putative c-di-GMP-specific phosphodiesterase class I)
MNAAEPVATAPRRCWLVMDDRQEALRIGVALRRDGWSVDGVMHDVATTELRLGRDDALPDVLLCGLRLADGDAFELMRSLAARRRPPSLFFVSRQQRAVIRSAIALAGACGIPVAGSAELPMDPGALARLLQSFDPALRRRAPPAPLPPLSRDELVEALDAARVHAWMQPKMRIATREVVGFEALMRARAADGSLVTPDRLIGGLSRHGLLDRATLQVFRQTVAFVAGCLHDGQAVAGSVNVSLQSLSDRAFCAQLAEAAEALQLDPSWITIEITETDAMADLATVIENTARIRMLGFNLAIDDFGTAYSSFFQLSRIPFSELKIERAFVADLQSDSSKRAIVQACAQLGSSLDMRVVAEGVETESELAQVSAAGCTEVQGYLVGRPMPADQAKEWLDGLDDLRVTDGGLQP